MTRPPFIIQFTNEARPEGLNIGGPVKASVVYENDGVEILRTLGNWLFEAREYADFRVDESHKLMVGLVGLSHKHTLCVIGRRRVVEQGFDTIRSVVEDLQHVQTVRVRLTNANNGDFLYEGQFRVTIEPLTIVPI